MKKYLFDNGGNDVKGIFRLAPDQYESDKVRDSPSSTRVYFQHTRSDPHLQVKAELNEGTFEKCDDINCISNAIKVWFRDLPRHLFAGVDAERVKACARSTPCRSSLHPI